MAVSNFRGYKYNGAIDSVDVRDGVVYEASKDGRPLGEMFTHDIFNAIPRGYFDADVLFIDPPWNLSNIKTFYLKADIPYDRGQFGEFIARVFEVIRELHVRGQLKSAFIEIGKQNVDVFERELDDIFESVRRYDSRYYNRHPCYILQGWDAGHFTDIPDEGKDELKMIDDIVRMNRGKHILDFCGGRGAISRTAFKYGSPFTLTELNRNRLAVAIKDIMDKGGAFTTRVV